MFLRQNHVTYLLICCGLATCCLMLGSCDIIEKPKGFAVANVAVIDAKNGQRENQVVYIRENRIVKVSAAEAFDFSKGIRVIDGSGKYLIPGLWDAHVHLTYTKELTPAMFDLFLKYGITSVRDTGGQLHDLLPLKKAAQKDPKNTPRVKIAGPLLDGIPTVYDGSSPRTPKIAVSIPTVDEAERQLVKLTKAGVDMLKVYEMLEPEIFEALLKKADSLGLPVTGHVPLSLDAVTAAIGMRSMEHLRNLELAFAKDWDSLLTVRRKMLLDGASELGGMLRANIHKAQRNHAFRTADSARTAFVLHQLAEDEVWQVPTLTIMTVASSRFFGTEAWKKTFEEVPESVGVGWKERLEKYMKTPINPDFESYTQWMLQMIPILNRANIPLMAGTDTPIFFLTPGYSLHEELALLVKAGLSPIEALDAATLQPARYFKMEHELGSIEEGMLADLVLLNANPVENIRNTTRIEAVIKDGKIHDKAALDSIQQRLESL